MGGFQRAKQRIVIKPRSVLLSKRLERSAEFGVCRTLIISERFSKNGILNLVRAREIDELGRPRRDLGQLIFSQQPCLGKTLWTNQQSVAGKRRIAGVRRIAIAGWSQRQNLP